jgi:hypothetical protein
VTLQQRDSGGSSLAKDAERIAKRERPYWIPTWFEGMVGLGFAAAWMLGVFVAIRHEDVGFFLTMVYLAMGLIGALVTWLLVWPIMRVLLRE